MSPATSSPPPPDYKPPARIHLAYLDGLRALAALWVVCQHTVGWCLPASAHRGGWGALTGWLTYAHLAVDVFIVLSGFSLAIPVARRGALEGGALAFFRRRAWRILPPYYAALGLALLLNAVDGSIGYPARHVPVRVLLVHLLLLEDWYPFAVIHPIDPPCWSVAVEWKVYFAFPMLVWVLRRRGPGAMLLAAAALAAAWTGLSVAASPGVSQEYRCPWYLFLFALGVCSGHAAFRPAGPAAGGGRPGPAGWVGLAGLAGAAWLIARPDAVPQPLAHLALLDLCVGAGVAAGLLLLTRPASLPGLASARALLSWRPLVWLGTFSYSLYLVHYPLFQLFVSHYRLFLLFGNTVAWHVVFMALVGIPLFVGASFLFFLACERPFLVRRRREPPAEVARDAALSPAP